ncbi:MAG TPA: rRNA maturation RNase YbeY [Hanamia sp.]|nr:rRNA maturation RNase YbeY [Hanamia sp.]
MGTITLNNHNIQFSLKDKLFIKSFLARVFAEERVVFKSVSYVFCTDEFLLKLNQEYLNHDTLTDILTFTLSNSSLPVVSEIYISVERVKENAEKIKVPFITELYRVMIHGILHLCGYTDQTKSEKAIMRKKEDHYLSLI